MCRLRIKKRAAARPGVLPDDGAPPPAGRLYSAHAPRLQGRLPTLLARRFGLDPADAHAHELLLAILARAWDALADGVLRRLPDGFQLDSAACRLEIVRERQVP